MNLLQTALALGSIIFSAGGFVAAVKVMRRDVNGIGRKVKEQELWRSALVRTLIEQSCGLEEAKKFAHLLPR